MPDEAVTRPEPLTEAEEHPMDAPLGDICETAFALSALHGLPGLADRLAAAHERIQQWLVDNDADDLRAQLAEVTRERDEANDKHTRASREVENRNADKIRLQAKLEAAERECATLRAERDALVAALEPFAGIATALEGYEVGDLHPLLCDISGSDGRAHHQFSFARIRECRQARAALDARRTEAR